MGGLPLASRNGLSEVSVMAAPAKIVTRMRFKQCPSLGFKHNQNVGKTQPDKPDYCMKRT